METFSAGLSKLPSECPGEHFERLSFLENYAVEAAGIGKSRTEGLISFRNMLRRKIKNHPHNRNNKQIYE